jgi:alpha-glucoside transport system permease protein
MSDLITALAAIVLGPLVTFGLYALLNLLVNLLPSQKMRKAFRPYVFIGPVVLLMCALLVWPTIQSVVFSFMNDDSSEFIGFDNYIELFGDPSFVQTVWNNVLWVVVVPATTIVAGLLIAVLTDKLGPIRERVFKAIIFMPMAISFVAASSIWRLNYSWDAGDQQIGMLNAFVKAIGGTPINWIQTDTLALNNLMIMVIVIWANVGFAMTLLSAAIKAVPEETTEAASLDGATGAQAFFTVLISSMKIFDVIWGMTGGNFGTNVLGVDFFLQYFVYSDTGKATAVVVLLMLAIIPVMYYQVRSYRKQEEIR